VEKNRIQRLAPIGGILYALTMFILFCIFHFPLQDAVLMSAALGALQGATAPKHYWLRPSGVNAYLNLVFLWLCACLIGPTDTLGRRVAASTAIFALIAALVWYRQSGLAERHAPTFRRWLGLWRGLAFALGVFPILLGLGAAAWHVVSWHVSGLIALAWGAGYVASREPDALKEMGPYAQANVALLGIASFVLVLLIYRQGYVGAGYIYVPLAVPYIAIFGVTAVVIWYRQSRLSPVKP